MTPKRIQQRRTAGWRLPDGAIAVSRPSRLGNPFPVGVKVTVTVDTGRLRGPYWVDADQALVVALYRSEWEARAAVIVHWPEEAEQQWVEELARIRGKDLACYCAPGDPCHADVLLDVANRREVVRAVDLWLARRADRQRNEATT